MKTKTNKLFKLVLVSLMFLSTITLYSQTATLTIPEEDNATAGTQVVVPFICSDISADPVAGLQFYIYWDPEVLTYDTYGEFYFTEGSPTVNETNVALGELIVVWTEDDPFGDVFMNPGDVFFNVYFDYDGGDCDITWGTSKGVPGWPEKGETALASFAPPVFFPAFTLTLENGYVHEGGSLAFTWDGSTDDSWVDLTNWTPEPVLVTDLDGADITIPEVTTKAVYPVITGPVTTGILNVAANAMLTVAPGGELTTGGLFTNAGYFYITSDNVGGAGSFMDNAGLAGTGFYRFDRYMYNENDPGGLATPDNGWHLISSPVNNTVSGDFASYWLNDWDNTVAPDGWYVAVDPYPGSTFCDGTSLGNVPVTGVGEEMMGYSIKRDLTYPTSATPPNCPCWVLPLHEMPGFGLYPSMMPDVIAFGGDAYNGFVATGVCITEPDYHWVDNATNAALMSNVNTGPYSTTVDMGVGMYAQWDLIGNPYSSPIANALFTAVFPAGVAQSVNFWDDKNLTYQAWAGGLGAPMVPATQGFFVEVLAAGPHTINLANTDRTHVGSGVYYKSEIEDYVTLQASGNGYADITYIRFLEEATSTFDSKWDAHKMFSTAPGVPQIYTTTVDKLAINALPATEMVHMAFTSATSGLYTIEAIETSNFTNVILEDKYTGIQTDLLKDSYDFEYTLNDNPNRFIVHFTPLGTPELEANSISIWSSERNIYVSVPQTVTGDVAVYNMMGQEVIANKIIPGMNVIPVNDVNTYYVVKVRSNNIVKTEKVFIR